MGYIHSLESFGTVDGPGVRFVVFFEGCPMRCQYCHNPDTWNPKGKVKYQKLPSGNSDYIEFYDKNGEMVATYSNNGWTMYTTNAEASRQTEMCMIYNEAWGNAKRGIPMAGEEMVNVVDMQSSFDAKA